MSKRQHKPNPSFETNAPSKKRDFPESSDSDKAELARYIRDPSMVHILNKKGISKFFPIQYETFSHVYNGKDIVARDRTGSGKTLAYSLPIITKLREEKQFYGEHSIKFLIILPTRELAIQVRSQIESLKFAKNDFKILAVYGGTSIQSQITELRLGVDVVVATPGRLIDLLNRKQVNFSHLKVTCLDEADEMLKQGFQDDIEKIFKFIDKDFHRKTQNLLFSATIPEWVSNLSKKYQAKDVKLVDLIKDSLIQTSKTVQHFVMLVDDFQKELLINPVIDYFLKNKENKRIIIFCETKKQVNQISESNRLSLQTKCLHGDVKQFQREKIFKQFKNGEIQCLVATNVAARGLDFPQINLVIQLEPPKVTETYIHRSGRTGRAGKKGVCFTFYSQREERFLKQIKQTAKIYLNPLNKANFLQKEKRYFREESTKANFSAKKEKGQKRFEPKKKYDDY